MRPMGSFGLGRQWEMITHMVRTGHWYRERWKHLLAVLIIFANVTPARNDTTEFDCCWITQIAPGDIPGTLCQSRACLLAQDRCDNESKLRRTATRTSPYKRHGN